MHNRENQNSVRYWRDDVGRLIRYTMLLHKYCMAYAFIKDQHNQKPPQEFNALTKLNSAVVSFIPICLQCLPSGYTEAALAVASLLNCGAICATTITLTRSSPINGTKPAKNAACNVI